MYTSIGALHTRGWFWIFTVSRTLAISKCCQQVLGISDDCQNPGSISRTRHLYTYDVHWRSATVDSTITLHRVYAFNQISGSALKAALHSQQWVPTPDDCSYTIMNVMYLKCNFITRFKTNSHYRRRLGVRIYNSICSRKSWRSVDFWKVCHRLKLFKWWSKARYETVRLRYGYDYKPVCFSLV